MGLLVEYFFFHLYIPRLQFEVYFEYYYIVDRNQTKPSQSYSYGASSTYNTIYIYLCIRSTTHTHPSIPTLQFFDREEKKTGESSRETHQLWNWTERRPLFYYTSNTFSIFSQNEKKNLHLGFLLLFFYSSTLVNIDGKSFSTITTIENGEVFFFFFLHVGFPWYI